MHLIPHQPHPPAPSQILHNLSFLFLLGLTAVPREIENTAYAKFWGAKKVEVAMPVQYSVTNSIQPQIIVVL